MASNVKVVPTFERSRGNRAPLDMTSDGAMLILFDLDDTLMDDGAAERSAATHLYNNVETPLSVEEFVSKWSGTLRRHFDRYLAGELSFQGQRRERVREMIDPSLADEIADRIFADYHAQYEAGWTLFPDAAPCLDGLSGFRLGVITNGQGDQQRRKLVRTGILDRFECVLISGECGCSKPDPAIFVRACASVGELPENSVYVGDRYDIDAQAARRAGLHGIWLDRKRTANASHTPPIVGSLGELLTAIADGETLRNHFAHGFRGSSEAQSVARIVKAAGIKPQ